MSRSDKGNARGIALIAVLWVMILLSVLAAALVAMSRTDIRSADLERNHFQVEETLQAAMNLAVVAISDASQHWPVDGTPQTISIDGLQVTVSVTAESGKIDLNVGNPDLIRGLLEAAGDGPGAAEELTQAIVARRQITPFTNIAELLSMPGVTEEFLSRLAPNMTLYSGSNSVSSQTAPIDVLLAIPGNTRADAEAEMARRSNNSPSATMGAWSTSVTGQAYSVGARLTSGKITRATRGEVVRLTGDPKRPIQVLDVH